MALPLARFSVCLTRVGRVDVQRTARTRLPPIYHYRASKYYLASRYQHLLKSFWGWRYEQLPDRTVIWTTPSRLIRVASPQSMTGSLMILGRIGSVLASTALSSIPNSKCRLVLNARGERLVETPNAGVERR